MRWLALLILLFAFATPHIAAADDGQTIHRCVGEHGEIVFSGVACGGNARADPRASVPAAAARPAVAMACPRSADELRDVFADALARRDTNAITSLVRWDGVGGAEARERLKEIAELGARPLIGVELGAGDARAGDALEPSATLTVRTGSTSYGGPREREFRIGASGGCFWLDW